MPKRVLDLPKITARDSVRGARRVVRRESARGGARHARRDQPLPPPRGVKAGAVTLTVSVTNQAGVPISGLSPGAFATTYDGAPATVNFAETGTPGTYASTLDISAPHPTADGRRFADLKVGDMLDGDRILSREVVAYPHAYTYDILPASSTGNYLANGHLIGSTLRPVALREDRPSPGQ